MENGHGGKREGAGRPKSSTKIYKTVRLEKDLLDKIEKIDGTFTSKIVRGLELLLEKEKK
ncbi:MAG: hypothetical protein MSH33_01720 [Fusobacterium necrophorum]|nr:hypothetical protein [Fusobacterium necrophorum]